MNLVELYLKKNGRYFPDTGLGHLRCYLYNKNHSYELSYQQMINAGMGKMFVYHCKYCNHSKTEFI